MAYASICTNPSGLPLEVRADDQLGTIFVTLGGGALLLHLKPEEAEPLACQLLAAKKHLRMARAAAGPESDIVKGNVDVEASSVQGGEYRHEPIQVAA